jgi:hypothetical protein
MMCVLSATANVATTALPPIPPPSFKPLPPSGYVSPELLAAEFFPGSGAVKVSTGTVMHIPERSMTAVIERGLNLVGLEFGTIRVDQA